MTRRGFVGRVIGAVAAALAAQPVEPVWPLPGMVPWEPPPGPAPNFIGYWEPIYDDSGAPVALVDTTTVTAGNSCYNNCWYDMRAVSSIDLDARSTLR